MGRDGLLFLLGRTSKGTSEDGVMGDRYFITVTCPRCGNTDLDVYYAPTCGFTTWECFKCGTKVDLEKLTGISYKDASNREELEAACKAILERK